MATIIIVNETATAVSINGIHYLKNFQSLVSGDSVRIVNVYDSRLEILPWSDYSEVSVDTVTYGSSALLQEALIDVLFYKVSVTGTLETVDITWESLVASGSRDSLQSYNITGSIDSSKDYGKVLLSSPDTFEWINALKETENIIII